MSPSVLEKKKELIQWLNDVEDDNTIDRLLAIKLNNSQDWWDILSTEEKVSIENGIKDLDEGNIVDHDEVRKIYDKWLTK